MKEVKVCGQCAEPLDFDEGLPERRLTYGCPAEKCCLPLCGTCSNGEVHCDEKGRCAKWWGTNLTEEEVAERMQEAALEKLIRVFDDALEGAGYEDARNLIQDTLVPLARRKKISLWDAAWECTDQGEERYTSWLQVFHALQKISNSDAAEMGITQLLE